MGFFIIDRIKKIPLGLMFQISGIETHLIQLKPRFSCRIASGDSVKEKTNSNKTKKTAPKPY